MKVARVPYEDSDAWTFRASVASPPMEEDEDEQRREYKRRRGRRSESRTNSISCSSSDSVRPTPGSVTLGTAYMGRMWDIRFVSWYTMGWGILRYLS